MYELNDTAGGFFRSARREEDNLPTEYSWHALRFPHVLSVLGALAGAAAVVGLYEVIVRS